jgi:hypothetical protein
MTVTEMRRALSKLYGPSWVNKVDKMKDAQVAAVYESKRASGAIKNN